MSFPTTNQTAFMATTSTGFASVYSMIRLSQALNVKPRSIPQLVAYGIISLLGAGASAGSGTAWMATDERTTPKEYLANAVHHTGVVTSGMIAATAQAVFMGAVEGIKGGVRDSVYEGIRGDKKPPESN